MRGNFDKENRRRKKGVGKRENEQGVRIGAKVFEAFSREPRVTAFEGRCYKGPFLPLAPRLSDENIR